MPLFFALYFGHKIYFAFHQARKGVTKDGSQATGSFTTRFFGSWLFVTATRDVDVITGKREMDALEAIDVPPVPRNWLEKFWYWLA